MLWRKEIFVAKHPSFVLFFSSLAKWSNVSGKQNILLMVIMRNSGSLHIRWESAVGPDLVAQACGSSSVKVEAGGLPLGGQRQSCCGPAAVRASARACHCPVTPTLGQCWKGNHTLALILVSKWSRSPGKTRDPMQLCDSSNMQASEFC